MGFYLITLITLISDQIIKSLIIANLAVGQSVPFIGTLVKLTYVRNTGAAFSLFIGFSSYLAVISLIVTLIVFYYHFRIPHNNYFVQIALALILGGSLGNLYDRLFRHYVVDFIDLGFFPVFNLADSLINVGVFLLIVYILFYQNKKKVA